jgi:hypothetical protein
MNEIKAVLMNILIAVFSGFKKIRNFLIALFFLPFAVVFYNRRMFVSYVLSFSLLIGQTAWAFDPINPPQNARDNPVEHIVVDPDRAGNTNVDRA